MLFVSAIFVAFSLGSPVKAEAPADNPRIEELFHLDQQDRAGNHINWSDVQARDLVRQESARSMLLDGQLRTAADFYEAAMIFRHGSSADDARLAYSLATLASTLSPADGRYRLLAAVMGDRLVDRPVETKTQNGQWRLSFTPLLAECFAALCVIGSLAFGYRERRRQKRLMAQALTVVAGQDYRAKGAELSAKVSELKAKSKDLERWSRAVER
jgi:hypothetical protein